MKELLTEIVIDASPEKVWKTLTDLDKYPDWNPFICHAVGKAEIGNTVDIDFRPDFAGTETALHGRQIPAKPRVKLEISCHAPAVIPRRAHFHHRTIGREPRPLH